MIQLGSSQLSTHHSSICRPALWLPTCFLEPWSLSLASPHLPQGEQTTAACLFWDLPICHLIHSRHSCSVWPGWLEPLHGRSGAPRPPGDWVPMLGALLLAGVQAGATRVSADLGLSTPSKEFISPPASHFKPQGPKGPGRLQFVLSTQPFCPSHHTDTHTDIHTEMRIYTHIHRYTHTDAQIHTHTHTQRYIPTYKRDTYTHMSQIHLHTDTQKHTHTCTHAHTHNTPVTDQPANTPIDTQRYISSQIHRYPH